jgi:hypothetical protein
MNVELQYRGRKVEVKIAERNDSACMDPQPATRAEMMGGQVKWASYDPVTKIMSYGGRGGEKFGDYDRNKDPEVFVTDWKLHDAILVKDQYVDGAKLSDWTYFNNQAKRIHSSCLWGLIHKVGLPKREANYWAKYGVAVFKEDILISRGLDLDGPIEENDRLNDQSIFDKEATRALYS